MRILHSAKAVHRRPVALNERNTNSEKRRQKEMQEHDVKRQPQKERKAKSQSRSLCLRKPVMIEI